MKKFIMFIVLTVSILGFLNLTNFELKGSTTQIELTKNNVQTQKSTESAVSQQLTEAQILELQKNLNVNIITNEEPITPVSIVKYLLSVLGSFITLLILNFLNKKFPNIFPYTSAKKYR